eukprot:EG_transcript_34526
MKLKIKIKFQIKIKIKIKITIHVKIKIIEMNFVLDVHRMQVQRPFVRTAPALELGFRLTDIFCWQFSEPGPPGWASGLTPCHNAGQNVTCTVASRVFDSGDSASQQASTFLQPDCAPWLADGF